MTEYLGFPFRWTLVTEYLGFPLHSYGSLELLDMAPA